MKSIFDKWNLRPGERRLVIIVMIVVFIILNFIFVWPRFSDWGKLQTRKRIANDLLHQYSREIANTNLYAAQLKELEKQGATVQSESQALALSTTVQNQAALSGVQVNRYDPVRQTANIGGKTNQFFEEQSGIINVTTDEKSLVDFLYNLGIGNSLIRVRSMTLNPDPQRQKLQGNVTLVASYAKRTPTRPAGAVAATPAQPPMARSTNAPSRSTSPFATATNAPAKATNQAKSSGWISSLKNWFKK